MSRSPGVSGSLGRVLHEGHVPVGTCFQVAPCTLATAWHVLADIGCDQVGSELMTDALDGTLSPVSSEVVAVDAVRDLALLRRAEPFAESVLGWAPSDAVSPFTRVLISGVAEVDDPGHSYEFLHATGEWQGGTVRDGVALGRLSSSAVMRGMSGAPVIRLADGFVLGVVSARYNSASDWLGDSVWVARTEDLTRLLQGCGAIRIHSRIVLGDDVGIVRTAVGSSLAPGGHAPSSAVGPVEAAREAGLLLTALDKACRKAGGLDDVVELLVSRVCDRDWDERHVGELRRRLRLRGLEPRVLLPRLAEHEESVRRWAEPLPGTKRDHEVSVPAVRIFLSRLRQVLFEELDDGLLAEASPSCRRYLGEALKDGGGVPLSGFLHALLEHEPSLRSASVDLIALFDPHTVAEQTGDDSWQEDHDRGSSSHGPVPGRPGLAAVAVQMCRLPAADPCTVGREPLVADIVTAIDRRMTRHGSATAFLCGQPGAGTSVVAVEAARALTTAFPDGVFYVDLYGLLSEASLNARTVVRVVAEALGLNLGSDVMDDARLIASFTARLHDRRVLLVLDNARDAAHVRPFVKAPASCGLIVTSRDRAQDYADPGLVFEVGPLERAASVEVLNRCSEGRDLSAVDSASTEALHRLAHLCGDIPLALRIVGARLAQPSGPAPSYLVQLLEEESVRLDGLSYGDRAVRLAIQLSHDALDPVARRVLRLITAAPGAAVTGAELGHCLEAPALRQELLLNRLVDRSLSLQNLVRMPAGELLATFRLFDLVRLFARERLEEDEPSDVVSEFQHASVSYLCARLTEITDQEHGAQLSGELDPTRFHAAQRLAQDNDWLDLATELAIGLHILYTARRELDAIIAINDDRITLHLRQGQGEEAVKACLVNAETLRLAGEQDSAAHAARRAADIARQHGLVHLVGEAEFALSIVLWHMEKWAESLHAGERAITALTSSGRSAAAAPIAINNCRTAQRIDDIDAAVRWGRRAVELADSWSATKERAYAFNQLGLAEGSAGNHRAALDACRRAAALWEELENLINAGVCYANAALEAYALDDPATAIHLLQLAADLWERGEAYPSALEALIDVSCIYANEDCDQQAAQILAHAKGLALGAAAEAPAMLRREALIRHAAASLFEDGSAGEPPPPPSTADLDRPAPSEEAGDAELDRVQGVLSRLQTGGLTRLQARQEVRSLLVSFTRTQSPCHDDWVYEKLDKELGESPMLGT